MAEVGSVEPFNSTSACQSVLSLNITAADGQKHRPVMIHSAILGSFERFLGILTENYAGDYPFWMHPEQIRVVPITDDHKEYAEKVNARIGRSWHYYQVWILGKKRLDIK